jgi:hypothetical protein
MSTLINHFFGPFLIIFSAVVTWAVPGGAQPLYMTVESLEWMAADSTVVVRGTIAGTSPATGPHGEAWSLVSLKVAETLKGKHEPALSVLSYYRAGDQQFVRWGQPGQDMLVFLVDCRRLGQDHAAAPKLALRPASSPCIELKTGIKSQVFTLDGECPNDPQIVLARARAAIAAVPQGARLCQHSVGSFGPQGSAWYGRILSVIVPIDRRLEAQAREWLKADASPVQTAPDRWRPQFPRREGARALGYFKSAENIALLKDLLQDAAHYEIVRQTNGKPVGETRVYGVREDAYRGLKEMEVDVATPVLREPLSPAEAAAAFSQDHAALSADARRVALGTERGTIAVHDVKSGRELFSHRAYSDAVNCVAFAGDGNRLAAGTRDGWIMVWDSASGRPLATLASRFANPRMIAGQIDSVALGPDGARLAASAGCVVLVWDVATGRKTLSPLAGRYTHHVTGMAFSRDATRLAAVGFDVSDGLADAGRLLVWDASQGTVLVDAESPGDQLCTVAFSPDGKRLATAAGKLASCVKLWDAATGRPVPTSFAAVHRGNIHALAFSPDGAMLASGAFDGARLWSVRTGRELHSYRTRQPVESLAFSPDGKRLSAADASGNVNSWDVPTGEVFGPERNTRVRNLAWWLGVSDPFGHARIQRAANDPTRQLRGPLGGQLLISPGRPAETTLEPPG